MDILEALRDLHKQATTERSHYYVAKCCEDAIKEITLARAALAAMLAHSRTHIAEGMVDREPGLEAVAQYLRNGGAAKRSEVQRT